MNKGYYLSTCDTCKRILRLLEIDKWNFELQDIKTSPVTAEQLEEMKAMAGSYEALFSRTARKYRELKLKNQQLGENDYRDFILNEYTFLKRPVFIVDGEIFIGNSKKSIQALSEKLVKLKP